jgi:peptidyl-prolyl cis-trans isomerase C
MLRFTPLISKKLVLSVAFSATLLSSSSLFAEDAIFATVNGDTIPQSQLEIAAKQSQIDYSKITDQQKKLLTEALVNRQLVLQEAIKTGFDKNAETAAGLKALTESYIAANYLAKIAQTFNVEDKDVKAFYDKNVGKNFAKEYKARHILVKTEDEAKALIKALENGADFSQLAKEKSTDAGSGKQGGDLGWFSEKDMVKPFSKAVAGLKKGSMVKSPIQSQFGWHVIILDDSRNTSPPEFDLVKENIKKILVKQKLNEYLTHLNTSAKVIYK